MITLVFFDIFALLCIFFENYSLREFGSFVWIVWVLWFQIVILVFVDE